MIGRYRKNQPRMFPGRMAQGLGWQHEAALGKPASNNQCHARFQRISHAAVTRVRVDSSSLPRTYLANKHDGQFEPWNSSSLRSRPRCTHMDQRFLSLSARCGIYPRGSGNFPLRGWGRSIAGARQRSGPSGSGSDELLRLGQFVDARCDPGFVRPLPRNCSDRRKSDGFACHRARASTMWCARISRDGNRSVHEAIGAARFAKYAGTGDVRCLMSHQGRSLFTNERFAIGFYQPLRWSLVFNPRIPHDRPVSN